MSKRKKRQKDEVHFDLTAIRRVKRRAKQVVAGLEEIERWLMKVQRWDRQNGTPEEIAAATKLYKTGKELRDKMDREQHEADTTRLRDFE